MKELAIGTRVYYNGDMANQPWRGVIRNIQRSARCSDQYEILVDDGTIHLIAPSCFSEVFLGHGGTRFVTESAYSEYRERAIADMQARYGNK